ncbi:MAG: hypothetical protein K2O22_00500 [Anaeroplasmataceae bacterium]|nr:hypothetical protein [Anaeroplasmataceae bacterium]
MGLASGGSVKHCTSYAELYYSSNAQCRDKKLKPRIGLIIGFSQYGVEFE